MDQKHSGLGIASFAISILFGTLLFVLVGIAAYVEATTPGGMGETSGTATMLGIGFLGLLAIGLVGVGLGIAGLFQPERRKLFSILGLSFSVVAMLAFSGLYVIGTMAA